VWQVSSGRQLLTLHGHTAGVGTVAFSPDGQRIATGSADRTIKVWTQSLAGSGDAQGAHFLVDFGAFSPNGKLLLSASEDKTAKLWEAPEDRDPLTLRDIAT